MITAISYYGYVLYQQNKIIIISEKDFSVEIEEKDITQLATKWVEEYTNQFKQAYIPKKKKIKEMSIQQVQVLDQEKNIVQIDFNVKTAKKQQDFFEEENWGTRDETGTLNCQWVLSLSLQEDQEREETICMVAQRQSPAAYDLEQYKISGQEEKDQEELQLANKKYHEDKEKQNIYKIEKAIVYVSYDQGKNWKKVESGNAILPDNNHQSKLNDNLYTISKEVTAIANRKNEIVYSNNQGNTWKRIDYEGKGKPMYLQFVNPQVGFLVECLNAALGGQRFIEIIKTEDGGQTWQKIGNGPNDQGSLHDGSEFMMINETLGFIVEPQSAGDSSVLYRTEDGMKTFQKVEIPKGVFRNHQGNNSLTWEQVYDTPTLPKQGENNELTLVVEQGNDGDYQGGTKAAYRSTDLGKTWEFIEEFKPTPETWEG